MIAENGDNAPHADCQNTLGCRVRLPGRRRPGARPAASPGSPQHYRDRNGGQNPDRRRRSFPRAASSRPSCSRSRRRATVLAYTPGAAIAREGVRVIVLDRPANRTFEAVVDLNGATLVSWTEVKGVQPVVLESEYDVMVRVVKADPRWQAAMKKRGIDDFEQGPDRQLGRRPGRGRYQGRRLLRALSYFKGDSTNFYGRPIEGVVALVDMNTEKVVEVIDTGVVPLPPPSQEFDEKSTGVRDRAEAADHHAAERRELHHQRPGDPLAEVALPLHDASARGPRAAHGRLRGRGTRAPDPLPRVALGDGRAVRRHRRRTGAGAAPSTSASTAWAGWPARSSRTPTRRRTPR